MKIGIVGCSARKGATPTTAKQLYAGTLFRCARRRFEAEHMAWRIASAKHGLIHPEQPIAPYDEALIDKTAAEMRAWSDSLSISLSQIRATFIVIAGAEYRTGIPGAYIVPDGIERLPIGTSTQRLNSRNDTMQRNKLLIIGVAPSKTTQGRPAFIGSSSGARLEALLGLQPGELGRIADTANLCSTFPGSKELGDVEPPHDTLEAAAADLDLQGYERAVLCGDAVRRAFGVKDEYLSIVEIRGVPTLVLPHPSGINRWWNDPANVRAAITAIRSLAPEAAQLLF